LLVSNPISNAAPMIEAVQFGHALRPGKSESPYCPVNAQYTDMPAQTPNMLKAVTSHRFRLRFKTCLLLSAGT
jgi:hypothetical protein